MQIGLDLGGSLIKVSLRLDKNKQNQFNDKYKKFVTMEFSHKGKEYYNLIFENKNLNQFYDFLETIKNDLEQEKIYSTGGGSFAYKQPIQKILGKIPTENFNEFKTIIGGIKYFETIFPDFLYTKNYTDDLEVPQHLEFIYPFLLANIGTGISINLVEKNKHTHVSGSALGGASVQGFYKQFYPNKSYEEITQLIKNYHKQFEQNQQNFIFEQFYRDYMHNNHKLNEVQTIRIIYEFQRNLIYNISHLTVKLAQKKNISSVVFSGNFLHKNLIAKDLFFKYFQQINKEEQANVVPYFLKVDGFLGSFTCLNALN